MGLTSKQTRNLVNSILKHKPNPGTKGGRPSQDPLRYIWPKMMTDTRIEAVGGWSVAYKKARWDFSVPVTTAPSQEKLVSWFRQMAEVMEAAKNEADVPMSELEQLAEHGGPAALYGALKGSATETAVVGSFVRSSAAVRLPVETTTACDMA